MKKLLSIVLALALCLTAFVGCLTVSAAGENTIVVDTANITTGAATTDVNVTITSAGVMALQFAIDYGTLAAPAVAYDEDAVTVTATEDKTGLIVEADANFTSTVITLTFDTAALTAGTYAITVNDVEAGNYDEATVAFETTAGAIVVADEVVEPTCEHENTTFVSAVPAVDGTDGSITFTCDDCGETVVETVEYHRLTTIANYSASAESEVLMQFDAYTNLFTAGSDVDSTILVLSKEVYNADPEVKILYANDGLSFTTGSYTGLRWTSGIAAKALNDQFTAYVYCKAGDQWYNGQVFQKSFTDYAAAQLAKADNVVKPAVKTVIMDLLNYGAEAQKTFGYDTDNLANAAFENYQSLATSKDITPDAINEMVITQNTSTDPVLVAMVNLMAESRVTIRYTMMPRNYTGSADDVTCKVTYTNASGAQEITFVNYDKAVADGLDDKIAKGEYFTITGGNYYLDLAVLAAAEMKTPVTLEVFVNGELSSTAVYSVQTFVARQRVATGASAPTAQQLALYDALLRYGDAALVAFG